MGTRRRSLSSAMTRNHNPDSLENDSEIEEYRHVFQVKQVVFQFPEGVFNAASVLILHLRPAGEARANRMPLVVVGDFLAELLDENGPLGPRPDKAHVAANHVEKLRQFIKAVFAEILADARHAWIVLLRPLRRTAFFGIGAHRAELEHLEGFAAQPYTSLPVNDRPG